MLQNLDGKGCSDRSSVIPQILLHTLAYYASLPGCMGDNILSPTSMQKNASHLCNNENLHTSKHRAPLGQYQWLASLCNGFIACISISSWPFD